MMKNLEYRGNKKEKRNTILWEKEIKSLLDQPIGLSKEEGVVSR